MIFKYFAKSGSVKYGSKNQNNQMIVERKSYVN